MEKINCEIIRDLLPGYVDGLTSEYTNEAVKRHLDHCEDCREIHANMVEDLYPPEEDRIPEPVGLVAFFKKVRSRAFLKGVLIASVVCLTVGGLAEAYQYARKPVSVPAEAVTSECYRMEDGSVCVVVKVDENYPVTRGWSWDNQMPMTMHAATDQVRVGWLYWLEDHIGLGSGSENEKMMMIPKEEAEDGQILFMELTAWDHGTEGASKTLYDKDTELQPAGEEMEQKVKGGKVYNDWLVDLFGYR